jgi:2-keto-4-pentenoate hydratase/2-oxohepta-3-ene-1,7-dioic acid hydratase in catechol pathway
MSVYCIGRNFADHAKELNNEIPTEPVVFLKPTSALVQGGGVIRFPASIGRVDHEVELVVKLGQRVPAHTPPGAALAYVSHYTVGIDVTGRDLQNTAKAKGMPWTLAKGMDTFAPMGPWVDRTLVDCAQVD